MRGPQSLPRLLGEILFREPLMRLAERYLSAYYRFDTLRRWQRPTPPEWFDHRADLYRWRELRIPFWAERGVFARQAMFQGAKVLDICSGDGFYAYHFYSGAASRIDCLDYDRTALAHARRWHSLPNIRFIEADVVAAPFPDTNYDVVVWDGAIEHFAQEAIRTVLQKCAAALVDGGVLCGYTIIARDERLSHPMHEHEFRSAAELEALLRETFPEVATFETDYPERRNIYFRCAKEPGRLLAMR